MPRYIDAEKLVFEPNEQGVANGVIFVARRSGKTMKLVLTALKKMVDSVPTVDAVEVVRCKDCAVPHNRWTGCPKLNGLIPPPDFYCAYGERRADNA